MPTLKWESIAINNHRKSKLIPYSIFNKKIQIHSDVLTVVLSLIFHSHLVSPSGQPGAMFGRTIQSWSANSDISFFIVLTILFGGYRFSLKNHRYGQVTRSGTHLLCFFSFNRFLYEPEPLPDRAWCAHHNNNHVLIKVIDSSASCQWKDERLCFYCMPVTV